MSRLFPWAECLLCSSILSQKLGFYSFLRLNNISLCTYPHFLCTLIFCTLRFCNILGIVYNAAMDIRVQILLWDSDFNSFKCVYRNGIGGSYDRVLLLLLLLFLFVFCFLVLHPWHMEVPRIGDQLKMQLLAYVTTTAIPDPSCICDLQHNSWQSLNPLSEARDWTHVLMHTSWVPYRWAMMGSPDAWLLTFEVLSYCFP